MHFFLLPPHNTHFLCPFDTHCFASTKCWFKTHSHGHTTAYKVDMRTFVVECDVA